ncbi:hypothetical protein ED236_09375 [Pseudomethylobacillus aquaticus]|uniref:DUF4148 domain-containing protein n=1 Tax=Pseudomethylobacillus aquaticus TaxID=2676064 RepID=A0A3N0UY02_9PROT|nr:hypothetical protein [Pseudomethylobacillus aquaticus]ROH85400.1 hypothetical protein ED236_09375 [Pseudomethylobacillus aquaticus]
MKQVGIVLVSMMVSGCAATSTPHFDAQFGDSVQAAKQRQVLYPAGYQPAYPQRGLDGKAANTAIEQYQKSFAQPSGSAGSASSEAGRSGN